MNDTTTAILSGVNKPFSIRILDWTTMTYNVQPVQFVGNRRYCGCALLKINGQLIVAVSGETEVYLCKALLERLLLKLVVQ